MKTLLGKTILFFLKKSATEILANHLAKRFSKHSQNCLQSVLRNVRKKIISLFITSLVFDEKISSRSLKQHSIGQNNLCGVFL